MKNIAITVFILLLVTPLFTREVEKNTVQKNVKESSTAGTPTFKLGVLFINSPTGNRFKEGITLAIEQYKGKNVPVELLETSYDNETDGLTKLESLLTLENGTRKVDIILGPTESGIFVRALENRKALEAAEIPVITSQVAAKVPHQEGGWFFRTNINVERRSQVIYDFLNKYWIRSIAVLYENDEFGSRAQEAFRKELNGAQAEHYLPLPYDAIDYTVRGHIKEILEKRPEAVGIFGTRSDFVKLLSLLKNQNADYNSYIPLTFSIIDTRAVKDELQEDDFVYFVSATDVPEKDFDDVNALSYDTTLLVLDELNNVLSDEDFKYEDISWRRTFRNRFESILSGDIELEKEGIVLGSSKSPLSFNNFENMAYPRVFKLSKSEAEIKPVELGEAFTLTEKLNHKVGNIVRRFGLWPLFNMLLILLIVTFTSIKDIKRWYIGGTRRLFKSVHFLLLLAGNAVLALGAYIYLGETGSIRYDSVLTAMILGLGPSAALRVTLFETAAGKSIGLAKYYDNFLQWVYERLTVRNYFKRQVYVNVIAYHNSVYGMKCLLNEVYRNSPNKERYIRMQTRIEEKLKEAGSWIDRRKAIARFLLLKIGWKKLVELNFVHSKFKEYDPEISKKNPVDPEEVLLETARRCASKPLGRILIEEKIKEKLEQLSPDRQKDLVDEHEKDLGEMKTPTAKMKKKIAFLFLLDGYDPDFRANICGTGETGQIINDVYDYCNENEDRKKKLVEEIQTLTRTLIDEQSDEEKGHYEKAFSRELGDLGASPAGLKKGIAFFFGYYGWDIDYLQDRGLLPRDYDEPKPQPEPVEK